MPSGSKNVHEVGRPFKPGQSGNPGGRPKRLPITETLREVLDQPVPGDKDARTWRQALVHKLLLEAVKSPKALDYIREIVDRVEGRAVQRQEWSGANGGPIQFETPASREETERRIAELMAGMRKPEDKG